MEAQIKQLFEKLTKEYKIPEKKLLESLARVFTPEKIENLLKAEVLEFVMQLLKLEKTKGMYVV